MRPLRDGQVGQERYRLARVDLEGAAIDLDLRRPEETNLQRCHAYNLDDVRSVRNDCAEGRRFVTFSGR